MHQSYGCLTLNALVISLASELHSREYYSKLYESFKRFFRSIEEVEIVEEPQYGVPEIPRNEYDLAFVIILTGGTSRLAERVARKLNIPVVLIAHNRHNSLASALSARERIRKLGVKVLLVLANDEYTLASKLTPMIKGISTAIALSRLRVLEVNREGLPSPRAKYFMEVTGTEVKAVSYKEVLEKAMNASEEDLKEIRDSVALHIDTSGVDQEYLDKALRIYYALRNIVLEKGYNAVSIDCFPFLVEYGVTPCLAVAMLNNDGIPTACEDDFYSLIMLFISLNFTGKPGWIANPSGATDEGYLRFAHCTIAPSLGKSCYLVPHFETGKPYAVTCRLSGKRYVFGRITTNYTGIVLYRGKKISSGLLEPGYCRTQLVLDTGPLDVDKFIEGAVGNHHVFMEWTNDIIEAFKALAWWMNWRLEIRN